MPIRDKQSSEISLGQAYAKFGVERPLLLDHARQFFAPLILDHMPDVITRIDAGVRRFSTNTRLYTITDNEHPSMRTLAHFRLVPDNLCQALCDPRIPGARQAVPIIVKHIDTIGIADIQQMPFTNQNRIALAIGVMLAQVYRKVQPDAGPSPTVTQSSPVHKLARGEIGPKRVFTAGNRASP